MIPTLSRHRSRLAAVAAAALQSGAAAPPPPERTRMVLAQNGASRETEGPLRKIITDLQRGAPDAGSMEPEIAGTAFILWANVGLKRIRADERQLHVSNYFRETSLPFSAIVEVKQNRWLSTKPITIYFGERTEFGDKVTFMPKQRFQFWTKDPTVGDLKKMAGLVN